MKVKSPLSRKIITAVVVTVLAAGTAGWIIYKRIFSDNITVPAGEQTVLLIPTGADINTVIDSLVSRKLLKDVESFAWVADRMSYAESIYPGRYVISGSMNNRDLIVLLRSGRQTPVKFTFNNLRTLEQFASRASMMLEADSVSIVQVFRNDSLLEANGFNSSNSISMLIPNTYELYWNTSAMELYERMLKEYQRFWNEDRKDKLRESNLTRHEVSVIASIVEQETQQNSEKPVVAGVYINRFRQGWKLEADPTLVYALGDFTIRRVLNQHKVTDSPYNTYKYAGLPPGPICIPGIPSIDAVLNHEKHDYYYFCAKDDFSGYHAFATSYADHLLNARRFHQALTRRGILK